jgi:hypothetical protein
MLGSGGVYDEARLGWLDQAACKALRDGVSIKTWINGVACADLVDPLDQTGFIALQVHAFQRKQPAQVRWRNLHLQDLGRHDWKPLAPNCSFQDVTVRLRFRVVSGVGVLRIGGSEARAALRAVPGAGVRFQDAALLGPAPP